MTAPTQSRVQELLSYDEKSGIFKWRINRCNISAGTVTGCLSKNGYLHIRIDKKLYLAHRLAWVYVHGSFLGAQIDHINGVRSDNRLCNLRLATNSQNQQNRKAAQSTSSTGVIGVAAHKRGKKPFQARIKKNGAMKSLGYFSSPELANSRYLEEKRQLHEFCTI